MAKLRIAIFTDNFLPSINGVVISVINLVDGLTSRGHEVLLIVPNRAKNPQMANNPLTHMVYVPSGNAFIYPGLRVCNPFYPGIMRQVKKFKPDIIHYHTPYPLGWSATIIAKLLHLPLVGTFHTFITDSQYLKHIHLEKVKLAQTLGWSYLMFMYRRCDWVTCGGKSTAAVLQKNGIKNVEVIPYTVRLDKVQQKPVRTFDWVKPENCNLVYLGRISHEKNIPLLLKSFQLAWQKQPHLTLTCIGSGPSLSQMKKLTGSLGLSKQVRFVGQVSHNRLLRSGMLAQFDAAITASTTETGPITVLESMAHGLPVIGVRAGGIPDMVDEEIGILAPKNNASALARAIISLASHPAQRKKMGFAAKKKVQKYEYLKVAKQWDQFYAKVIANHKSAR